MGHFVHRVWRYCGCVNYTLGAVDNVNLDHITSCSVWIASTHIPSTRQEKNPSTNVAQIPSLSDDIIVNT